MSDMQKLWDTQISGPTNAEPRGALGEASAPATTRGEGVASADADAGLLPGPWLSGAIQYAEYAGMPHIIVPLDLARQLRAQHAKEQTERAEIDRLRAAPTDDAREEMAGAGVDALSMRTDVYMLACELSGHDLLAIYDAMDVARKESTARSGLPHASEEK